MSDIVERTLASIPRFLSSSLLGGGRAGPAKQTSPPRALQALLQAVDSAQSRSEEEAVVYKELSLIKQRLNQPEALPGQLRELLPRIIFCSVIGYDVSFCKIHAIKLAQSNNLMEKRAGYLATTLLLHPGEEIAILMTCGLQKDLTSSNMLDNCQALTAAAYLIATEYVPLMLPAVLSCLNHKRELVREKAVHCLHAFFLRAHSLMSHTLPQLNALLKDKDPGVLSALVSLFVSLAPKDPDTFLPLGMPLLNVLQQVRGRRFAAAHDYHSIPLPWLQISLLKVLGTLGMRDHDLAAAMLATLEDIMREVNPREPISLAVVYQCVLTVAKLGQSCQKKEDKEGSLESVDQGLPNQSPEEKFGDGFPDSTKKSGVSLLSGVDRCDDGHGIAKGFGPSGDETRHLHEQLQPLLHHASQCVASFLRSGVHNLRYLGVKSLAQLVVVSADLAVDHQMAVVKCLDDPDPAVRHQTLTLLHHMANPANVKVICFKLLEHVSQKGVDPNICTNVARMVCDIAGRFSPDPKWYLDTLLPILSLSIDPQVVLATAENMLQYLIKASMHQSWPEFSEQLFLMMVGKIQKADISTETHILQFALRLLRFVPMQVCEIDGNGFLSSCKKLLEADKLLQETKEMVILCVQHLMLKGLLDSVQVTLWLKATGSPNQNLIPRRFRQLFAELHTLASLQASDRKLVAAQLFTASRQNMDFTLSFADAYISEVLEKDQPLLKRQTGYAIATAGVGASYAPHADDSSQSPPSHLSLSTSSPGEAYGQETASLCTDRSTAGNSLGLQSASSSLRNIPGLKQVWTREGVSVSEGSQKPPTSQNLPAIRNVRAPADASATKAQEEVQQEELARALFQGISQSPPQSVSESVAVSSLDERVEGASVMTQRDEWEMSASVLPTADTGGWRALLKGMSGNQTTDTTVNSHSTGATASETYDTSLLGAQSKGEGSPGAGHSH
ncbi:hypothetical protein BaRGS_00005061 [Batillaria attramentaria]|uniref:Clathrin/coatomer adaptor adaptin-like N-terminal domain-containing protein n=1 Tax=Batillaria attramentaria TaxID=370345 RepID=A0ABD0LVI9_9CAEN